MGNEEAKKGCKVIYLRGALPILCKETDSCIASRTFRRSNAIVIVSRRRGGGVYVFQPEALISNRELNILTFY
jgi:hypothetical protein